MPSQVSLEETHGQIAWTHMEIHVELQGGDGQVKVRAVSGVILSRVLSRSMVLLDGTGRE